MANIEIYETLVDQVEEQGLIKTSMGKLKDAQEAGRLGVNVRETIKRTLEGYGLGTLPESLPANQEDEVRLYKKSSKLGGLIQAVLRPSDQGDTILLANSDSGVNPGDYLMKIREIVKDYFGE
jgi:hypothetical protein